MTCIGSWIMFVNDFLCHDVKCRCLTGTFQDYLLVLHFSFFKYIQGLMQERLQLLKNVRFQSSLSYADRQLDLKEAGQAKDSCGRSIAAGWLAGLLQHLAAFLTYELPLNLVCLPGFCIALSPLCLIEHSVCFVTKMFHTLLLLSSLL